MNTAVSAMLPAVILHDKMTCSPTAARMWFQVRFHAYRLKIPLFFFDGLSCMPYLSVSTPVLSGASLLHPISDVLAAPSMHISAMRDTTPSGHSASNDAKALAIVV